MTALMEQRFIEQARAVHETDELEIDNNPTVVYSPEDKGAWVSAWVWVYEEGE